ncbi:hypothetical protein [Azotobacter chroococcum]|uniref:hypothetical protein n=1 Tax=Azotobacter chroococcum TaxID=353 RepID=UPI0010AE7AC0|nr:hypothetical protein [Azotobacter chroococcum]TKD30029.1 hypothetical protein FCG41_24445 [Azotobacter chroococcum]
MSEKTYPYTAWVLLPSFKPKLETFVCHASYGHEEVQTGKWYLPDAIYETKAKAIAAGREKIKTQLADLEKRREKLNKKIASLDKAERE